MKITVTEEMREALARYYRATSDSLTPDKAVASEAMERASKASMDLTHLVAEAGMLMVEGDSCDCEDFDLCHVCSMKTALARLGEGE